MGRPFPKQNADGRSELPGPVAAPAAKEQLASAANQMQIGVRKDSGSGAGCTARTNFTLRFIRLETKRKI